MKALATVAVLSLTMSGLLAAKLAAPSIAGDYLEVRSCDVFTGPCFANSETGLSGKEGILLWSVREGSWKGVRLDGLKVLAVLRANDTLGNVRYEPRQAKAVLIVDAQANPEQKAALAELARTLGGNLLCQIAETRTAPIEANLRTCSKAGCAAVKAGSWVEIVTRCFGDKDHVCGNEENYYPPLTDVSGAYAAFTEVASFKGSGLDLTWEAVGQRSAYLATFTR